VLCSRAGRMSAASAGTGSKMKPTAESKANQA
jgi:hypothetical protein